MKRNRPLDIAIVGMACRFPGAPDLVSFWENILSGKSSIGEVPPDRWSPEVFFQPDSDANDRVNSRRGGYLDFPILIDAAAHGVMPQAIDGGEPEQHLILDAARSAMADAGLAEGVADGRRVEVVIGRGNYFNRGNLTRLQHGRIAAQTIAVARSLRPDLSDEELEALRLDLKAGLPPFDAATIPGQLTNATAGRVANRLNLRGASFVVDAASASSLVALDLGARALIEGRADLAFIGGVYVQSDVDFPMVFSRLGALSPSGIPRPFGLKADGMVPGEGAGVVVLKRLRDAETAGDRVYAILKAVGIASDGRGSGLGVPNARGHALAMKRAYRRSGLDPASVGLIEGHGLGVPAADRAELRALRDVFPPSTDRVLGAVSSLIGHAMPASGIAGLIKTALALHHRALPPTLGADEPHPLLRGRDRPATALATARPWVHGGLDSPRRAAVNAFGFAGINAHAVLEEQPASAVIPGCLVNWESEAILLDAPDRSSLQETMERLADRIEVRPDVSLKDLAFTIHSATGSGSARLGLVVGSTVELVERLRALIPRIASSSCRSIRDNRGTYFRDEAGPPSPLAVIFPGEGSQYPGMLRDLAIHFPTVLTILDTSDRIARDANSAELPSLLLYGEKDAEGLWAIGTAVNVVLSAQWALYGLLVRLGIRPGAVVGHSSGEFLAMAACGSVRVDRDFEDALGGLAAVFEGMESSGAVPEAKLLAVAASRERIKPLMQGLSILVAMDNCPHQVVVAGPSARMVAFEGRLNEAGILWEVLPFARGYHTPDFAPAVPPIRRLLDSLDVAPPAVPIYSCASAAPMPRDPCEIRGLAEAQWSRPVRFRETIERMHADGFATFVDVGPRGHLAGFVDDILRGKAVSAVAMGLPRRSGITQLNHLVATLFSLGHPLDTAILYERRRPVAIDLEAPPPLPPREHLLKLGFPEMKVSRAMAERLDRLGPGRHIPRGMGSAQLAETRWEEPTLQSPDRHDQRGTESDPRHSPTLPVFSATSGEADEVMLDSLRTMDQFLATQHEVMAAYLQTPADTYEPGPWAGEIREIEPGIRVVTVFTLDQEDDPVAAHHTLGGRRVSAVEPERLGLPVLPFAVMAEMLAQAAAILRPGEALTTLKDVTAHRWIRYEDAPVALEIEARSDSDPSGEIRVAIFNRGSVDAPRPRESPVFEGTAAFAPDRSQAPEAAPFAIRDARESRFSARRLYDEQWLFHGPALQAVSRVGSISESAIEGSLRVLPRGPLLRDPEQALRLLTDPIVLDNFTHLLGTWGLDRLDGGDVVFPLRMGELALLGDPPVDLSEVSCRIRVTSLEHHRVRADAEIVRDDGTVWMRIRGWEDWRFHWPSRYRDVFRRPDVELLSEDLPLDGDPSNTVAGWLQPPADMGRPVWRDVLEQTQLSPTERGLIATGPEERRSLRLWGRIAAKDAARRLDLLRGSADEFPADLEILPDPQGRPVLRSLRETDRVRFPAVSIAHTSGVAVALATNDPEARPGIDVERIVPRSSDFESIAFSPSERKMLDLAARSGDRDAWIARFWCAKEAAAKAAGSGLIDGPRTVEVVGMGPGAGVLMVDLGPLLGPAIPGPEDAPILVTSEVRDEFAWAWTLGSRSVLP